MLEQDPENVELLVKYGGFLLKNGRSKDELENARIYFKKALEIDPGRLDTHFKYANFLCAIGEFQAGRDLLQEAIDLSPNNSKAHEQYASLWMQGEWGRDTAAAYGAQHPEEADLMESHYLKAIELDSNNATAYDHYGLFLYWVKQDYDAAFAQGRKMIEVDPQEAGPYWLLAALMDLQNRDRDEIEKLYMKAIEVEPDDPTAHFYYYSFLNYYQMDKDKIEQELLKLLEIAPDNRSLKVAYGRFLQLVKKDLDGAELLFKQALDNVFESDVVVLDILTNLGSVQFLKNDADSAKENIDRALFITAHEDLIALTNFGPIGNPELQENYRKKILDETRLGCLYLLYAYDLEGNDLFQYMQQIKGLVDAGIHAPGWSITIELHAGKAAENGHPEARFLSALGQVIAGARKPKSLEKFTPWAKLAIHNMNHQAK